jgi:hypothetical protein
MVQNVERFHAELEVLPLGDGELLQDRSVEVVVSVGAQVPERAGEGAQMELELAGGLQSSELG